MNFDEINKIYNKNKYTLESNNKNNYYTNTKKAKNNQDVQFNNKFNPRLWHALNNLYHKNNTNIKI